VSKKKTIAMKAATGLCRSPSGATNGPRSAMTKRTTRASAKTSSALATSQRSLRKSRSSSSPEAGKDGETARQQEAAVVIGARSD
jgi:hypothetical protein